MNICFGFTTGNRPTLTGDLGGLKVDSSNSAETGLERARRLTICPPGEIASATSSLFLLLVTGRWKMSVWDPFTLLSRCLSRNSGFSESSSSISQPESLRMP